MFAWLIKVSSKKKFKEFFFFFYWVANHRLLSEKPLGSLSELPLSKKLFLVLLFSY